MRLDVQGHRTLPSGVGYNYLTCGAGCGIYGTPLVGFMAYNNANAAPGKLANYGGTVAHHATACIGQTIAPLICPR